MRRWMAMAALPIAVWAADPAKPLSLADLLQASTPAEWRDLDPQSTLYMELPAGRVVIELAPDYAPASVGSIRKLVRDKYFDGSFVIRSQDNYVVQWARPESDERAKAMAKVKGYAEFERATDRKLEFTDRKSVV